MKKQIMVLSCALALATALTGCNSRESVDAKLAKGCEAGVKSILAAEKYTRQIDSVKTSDFSTTEDKYRKVSLKALTKDKQYGTEKDEEFTCVFQETYLPGFNSYKGILQDMRIDEEVFGVVDGKIQGTVEEHLKLTDTVQDAMK